MERIPIPKAVRDKLKTYCGFGCCNCPEKSEIEIHHIDGNPSNNNFENLILLCPTCHNAADKGTLSKIHLQASKESRIEECGFKNYIEKGTLSDKDFKDMFDKKLKEAVYLVKIRSHKANDKIDELIALTKIKIDQWNVMEVEYATKQMFLHFYHESEVFNIYTDLFDRAYSNRKHILGKMIQTFYFIACESWLTDYKINKASKACDVLLKLAIKYADKDLAIVNDCVTGIDNIAGDWFDKKILSKLIVLASFLYSKKNEEKYYDLFEKIMGFIEVDDTYAWDAGIFDYVESSFIYAKPTLKKLQIYDKEFEVKHIIPIITDHKKKC